MTTCIKCGAPIADGELFCAQCAQNGTAEQAARNIQSRARIYLQERRRA